MQVIRHDRNGDDFKRPLFFDAAKGIAQIIDVSHKVASAAVMQIDREKNRCRQELGFCGS